MINFKKRTYHGYRSYRSQPDKPLFIGRVERDIPRPDGQVEMMPLLVPNTWASSKNRLTANYFDWGLGGVNWHLYLAQDPQGTLALAMLRDCMECTEREFRAETLRELYRPLRDKVIIRLPREEFFLPSSEIEAALEEDLVLAVLNRLGGEHRSTYREYWGQTE